MCRVGGLQQGRHRGWLEWRPVPTEAFPVRVSRNIRKHLDMIAERNEDAALVLMRAAESTADELLRQQLLKAIHDLNQDALTLRALREHGELLRA